MGKLLNDKINSLTEKRRQKILNHADGLIKEELTLREIRSLRRQTQEQIAVLLQKRQDEISRFEKREDFLLSSLNDYIEALGGHLKLVVEFDDSPSIVLSNPGYKNDNLTKRDSSNRR